MITETKDLERILLSVKIETVDVNLGLNNNKNKDYNQM